MDILIKAKLAVVAAGLGICSLSEPELLARLEALYFEGFKAGVETVKPPPIDMREWRSNGKDSGV